MNARVKKETPPIYENMVVLNPAKQSKVFKASHMASNIGITFSKLSVTLYHLLSMLFTSAGFLSSTSTKY